MGGGDLNLKKSWHPSTLRNIERVWKAEQKHEAEQQKIEQLQKELAAERAREEIHAYAEDQGVVRKKDERLDWMYQGPAALVSRDDYLMGRKIDKTLELIQMQENGQSEAKEEDHQLGSLFRPSASTSNVTVDLATKIREDPLFAIMKREKEQRKSLLSNPVKMKQLKKMLEKSLTKGKKGMKKKEKRRKHESSSSSNSDSDSSDAKQHSKRKQQRSDKYEDRHSVDKYQKKSHRDRHQHSNYRSYDSEEHTKVEKMYNDEERNGKYSSKSVHRVKDEYSKQYKKTDFDHSTNRSASKTNTKKKLSSEEKEQLRQEMMENAKWRDKQRQKNVEHYIKEGEFEDSLGKGSASSFIRPMLSRAAECGSVESRVKQKIFTIQRKRGDMDSNFARR